MPDNLGQKENKKLTISIPWLPFYGDRFLKETLFLNPLEVATYYRLFEVYTQQGHLPNDEYLLHAVTKLDSALSVFRGLMGGAKPDPAAWDTIKHGTIHKVLNQFFRLSDDGNYHHAGWDKELDQAALKYANSLKRVAAMNEKRRRGPDVISDDHQDGADTAAT